MTYTTFMYKLAARSAQEDSKNKGSKKRNAGGIETTSRGGVLGGLLALGAMDKLYDYSSPKGRNMDFLPPGKQNAFNIESQNRRLNRLLRSQGYQQSKMYTDPDGTVRQIITNPDSHKSIVTELGVARNTLRNSPGTIWKNDIDSSLADAMGVDKKDGVVQYEPGSLAHTNLGDMSTDVAKMLRPSAVDQIGRGARALNGVSTVFAGLVGTGRNTNPEIQKKYDRIGKAIVGAGTLGGLVNAGINAHASYRSGKILQAAGIKDRRSFLGQYKSLPGDLLLAATPAIAYYSTRHLPDKIKGLYNRLTNRNAAKEPRQELSKKQLSYINRQN